LTLLSVAKTRKLAVFQEILSRNDESPTPRLTPVRKANAQRRTDERAYSQPGKCR
jgi:hypothetical protein